jgi:hypothetical protein
VSRYFRKYRGRAPVHFAPSQQSGCRLRLQHACVFEGRCFGAREIRVGLQLYTTVQAHAQRRRVVAGVS